MSRFYQRSRLEKFFPVPNEIFNLGLTDGEILVYTFLMRCEDRKTFKCHPSYATICEAIGRSKNSVKKYVQGLEKKGLIFTEPIPRKIRKSGTGSIYQINDHLWEGSFYPRLPNGKRKKFNVYAETREQCETKLAEMIAEKKAEIAEEKAKLKEGAD